MKDTHPALLESHPVLRLGNYFYVLTHNNMGEGE